MEFSKFAPQKLKEKASNTFELIATFIAIHSRKVTLAILAIVIVVALTSAYFLWNRRQDFKKDPVKMAQQENQEMIKNISRHIILPEGETPTIATVSDPARLQNQPFFTKAKKGDKVFIFANIGRIILYDPIADKIVNIATMDLNQKTAPAVTTTPSP